MTRRRRQNLDTPLLAVTVILVCLGLVMVYSSSAIYADRQLGSSLYFLKRQLLWAFLGLTSMAIVSRINYNILKEWMWPILVVTVVALVYALCSDPIAEVRRWIQIGPVRVQPSEFAKITAVIFLAYYLDRKRSKVSSPWKGTVIPASIIFLLIGLISLGKDLGSPILIFTVTMLVIFIGGGRVRYLFGLSLLCLPLVLYEVLKYEYRRERIMSFLAPWDHAQTHGYQLTQALMAVGSGGWFGKGIGASKLKLMYLPAPHTDFIFPVICEELGLLGAMVFLGLFATILVRGLRIARSAPNLFGTLLAAGISFSIALQAFINIGMSIGILPTKGIPLPFISFGGSSLIASLIGVGILLNISRHCKHLKDTRLEVPLGSSIRSRP